MATAHFCPSCQQAMETLPTRPRLQEHFYCREENLIFALSDDGLVPCEDAEAHVLFFPARAGRP